MEISNFSPVYAAEWIMRMRAKNPFFFGADGRREKKLIKDRCLPESLIRDQIVASHGFFWVKFFIAEMM